MHDLDHILQQVGQVSGPTEGADGARQWRASCPAHVDQSPSFSITETRDGGLRLKCFAGCTRDAVYTALGLSSVWMPGDIVHDTTYPYTTVDGDLVFEVLRGYKGGKKHLRQRVPDQSARSGYRWSLRGLTPDQREILYRLPQVRLAIDLDETVYVVEGEKDVHTAVERGLTATCNAQGAGKFTERHAEQLAGARVVIIMDKDDAGRGHGALVYDRLKGVTASVSLRDVHPSLGDKADLTDHIEAGYDLDDLVEVDRDDLPPGTGGSGGHSRGASRESGHGPIGFSDNELSERFTHEVLDGRYLWTRQSGWLQFTGRCWECCSEERVVEEARAWLKTIGDMLLEQAVDLRLRDKVLNRVKATNIVFFCRGQAERDFDDFDADHDVLVVGNGVVDLRTGELHPHDPELLVTKCTPVEYYPGASHPDWDQALTAVAPSVAAWLQARLGQSITGYPPDDDAALIAFGQGDNGKSAIVSATMRAMGDHAGTIPDAALLDTKGHAHPTEKMSLRGLRLAVMEETPEDKYLNINNLKKFLGTDEVVARYSHQDNVRFRPTWAVLITSNYELGVKEGDHGTWRRLLRVPFPYRFRLRERGESLELPDDRFGDPRLRDRVKAGTEQLEAVLAWLVAGAVAWYERGRVLPSPPAEVAESTAQWRAANDIFGVFADEQLIPEPGAAIWLDDLHRAVSEWQRHRAHHPWSMVTLKARVASHDWFFENAISFSGQATRDPSTLSRPTGLATLVREAPTRPRCLLGARFRTRADDMAELQALPSPTPSATPTAPPPSAGPAPGVCDQCGGPTEPHPDLRLVLSCPACHPEDFAGVAS